MFQPQTDQLQKVSRPPVVYRKGVRLFEPGHSNRLFCVVSGMVHAYTVNEYGDRRHVEFYGPGEFFGGVTQGDQCFVAESLEKECVVHSWEPYECERVRQDGRLQEWWWKRSLWHQGIAAAPAHPGSRAGDPDRSGSPVWGGVFGRTFDRSSVPHSSTIGLLVFYEERDCFRGHGGITEVWESHLPNTEEDFFNWRITI